MIIDLQDIITKYKNERRLGLIFFGEADSGKTKYAQKFLTKYTQTKGLYINVENGFANSKKNEDIFSLNPEKFLKWIKELIKPKNNEYDYYVIDEMDFLFNFWDDNKKTEFIKRVQLIEKTEYSKPVIFVLQDDEILVTELKKEIKTNEENPISLLHLFKFKNLKQI